MVLAVVVPYGINKFVIMKDYSDTNFQNIIVKNAIDPRTEHSHEETNLNLMLYFKNKVGAMLSREDMEGFVVPVASVVKIDRASIGRSEFKRTDVGLRICTSEDFQKFNSYDNRDINDALGFAFCVNDFENLSIAGNFGTDFAQNYQISI